MKDYKRLTDRVIAEMLRNTEGESWDSDNIEAQCYIRLAELEDKIESGELISTVQSEQGDYLTQLIDDMMSRGASNITDTKTGEIWTFGKTKKEDKHVSR